MSYPAALTRALAEIDALGARYRREAHIARKARIREFARQFSQDRTGLLTWLNEANRAHVPMNYASVEESARRIPIRLRMERELLRKRDWKARPELVAQYHERAVVSRYLVSRRVSAPVLLAAE